MRIAAALAAAVSTVLVLALAPATAASARPDAGQASVATAQPAVADSSVHFTAAGDFGSSANAQGVFAGMASGSPDFGLALGDFSYGGAGSEQAWCNLVKSQVGQSFPFELITGNHESDGEDGSIDNFAACLPNRLPGLVGTYGKEWYVDVPAANPIMRIVMISPSETFPDGQWKYTVGSPHYNWTAAAIDGAHAAGIPWVVVGMHKPCLTLIPQNCSSGPDLMNLLVEKHVDLVLQGHVHMYERTKELEHSASCPTIQPNTSSAACIADSDNTMTQGGTVFTTIGTGGETQQHPKLPDPEQNYFAAHSSVSASSWGYLDVTANDNQLSASFQTTSGAALSDAFTINRSDSPPGNAPPSAVFASSCSGLGCGFDGSGSSDSDGSLVSYAWSFGDGGTGSGVSPSHTYGSGGTFPVTLTVTDDGGATDAVTHSVTVSSGGGGGGGVGFVAAVHGQSGSVKTQQVTVPAGAGVGDRMVLVFTHTDSVSWSGPLGVSGWTELDSFDNGSTTSTVWQKSVAGGDAGGSVRFTSGAYSKGALVLGVYSGVGAGSVVSAHAGDAARSAHVTPVVTAPAGALVVSVWTDKSGSTTGWTAPAGVSVRDTAVGTGGGRFGALWADSGAAVAAGSYGGLTATTNAQSSYADMWTIALPGADGGPPANNPPTAAFTSSCTQLSCTFDGGDSADSDGTISSYAWTFGDNGTDTGATSSHSYATGGTFPVTLTVTDNAGATGSVTHDVIVSSDAGGSPIDYVAGASVATHSVAVARLTVPAAAQAGDEMVFAFTGSDGWTGPTGVSGWTRLGSVDNGTSTSAVWVKQVAPGDPGSVVQMTNDHNTKAVLDLAVYSGVDLSAIAATAGQDAGQATHTSGSATVPAGAWVLSYWADRSTGTSNWSAPSGVTTRSSAAGTGGGHFSSLLTDSAGPVAAGTYGPLTARANATSTNAEMWTVVLPAG